MALGKKNGAWAVGVGVYTFKTEGSLTGCKESQFYSLPFEQAVASVY